MKLYYSPGACSLAVHIALREARILPNLVKVDLTTHTLPDGTDYRRVNPLGQVPVLVLEDGQLLTQGAAILHYIADHLDPALGNAMPRRRFGESLAFIGSELIPTLGPLFNPTLHAGARDALLARLRPRLDWMTQRLQGDFLGGERYSVADAYLFTIFSWLTPLKIDASAWPALVAHSGRVAARPAVLAALRAEGLAQ
jgi:glutathione S-transferase